MKSLKLQFSSKYFNKYHTMNLWRDDEANIPEDALVITPEYASPEGLTHLFVSMFKGEETFPDSIVLPASFKLPFKTQYSESQGDNETKGTINV